MSHYARLPIMVWDSDRAVIRAALKAMSRDSRRNSGLRDEGKRFYRDMLDAHHAQQRLCARFRL